MGIHKRFRNSDFLPTLAMIPILLFSIFPLSIDSDGLGSNSHLTSETSRSLSNVVINEILYDPIGNEAEGEFVEILNPSSDPVDMTGWRLTDNDGSGYDLIIPSMTLPGDGYLAVWTTDGVNDTDASDGHAVLYMKRTSGIWTNSGDDVNLLNDNGTLMDYLAFGNGTYVDDPPSGIDWKGDVIETSEGSSLCRSPDGFDTNSSSDFTNCFPTPGSSNKLDLPPTIEDLTVLPSSPSANEDVLIQATVRDDLALISVSLDVLGLKGIQTSINMVGLGSDDRFQAWLDGYPEGSSITITLKAIDSNDNINRSAPVNITFHTVVQPFLRSELNISSTSVIPNGMVLVEGDVNWSNGDLANGTVTVRIPSTAGTWTMDFNSTILITITAPSEEGTYEMDVIVIVDNETLSKRYDLLVNWPQGSLDLLFEVSVLDENTTAMTGDDLVLSGKATFKDGSYYENGTVHLAVYGTSIVLDVNTDGEGGFHAILKAPSISGDYMAEARIEAIGHSWIKTIKMSISDDPTLNIWNRPFKNIHKGDGFVVNGQALHHDRSPFMNSMVVVEILNSTKKARGYTDQDGNFSIYITVPTFKGKYLLRVTAISGNAMARATEVFRIKDHHPSMTPSFTSSLTILVLALMVLKSRRGRDL